MYRSRFISGAHVNVQQFAKVWKAKLVQNVNFSIHMSDHGDSEIGK